MTIESLAADIVDRCDASVGDCKLNRATTVANLIRSEFPSAQLREAAEAVIEAGRPHTGANTPNYPDGCGCDQCEAWDALNRLIK